MYIKYKIKFGKGALYFATRRAAESYNLRYLRGAGVVKKLSED
jgi:hypothetical protein